jgi:AraC-like DNA-binding protein
MRSLSEVIKQRVERVIVENEMLRAGFAALPYVVLRDSQLSIGARLAYAVLLSYAWQEDSTFVGQAKMAKDMGISERQLQRYLYELRDSRYISISRADRRFNNTYIIKDVKTKLKHKKRA